MFLIVQIIPLSPTRSAAFPISVVEIPLRVPTTIHNLGAWDQDECSGNGKYCIYGSKLYINAMKIKQQFNV